MNQKLKKKAKKSEDQNKGLYGGDLKKLSLKKYLKGCYRGRIWNNVFGSWKSNKEQE